MAKRPGEMDKPRENKPPGASSGTETIQRSPADPSQALLALPKGTLVDEKYQVVGQVPIGQGGMGVVYLAKDVRSAERAPLALKILRPDRVSDNTAKTLFAREQDWGFRLATGGARQDHLVVVVSHGEWDYQVPGGHACRVPYFAMEYVEGPSLEQLLKPCKEKGLDPDEAFRISLQMAEGLLEAHRVLVHRDLKPSNVLIRESDGCVKLSDFGIGWSLLDTGKRGQTVRQYFTMEYASPEQLRGEDQDGRSDQYSLGLILSELFSGFLYDLHHEHAVGGTRHLPFALDSLIRRACARNRADRYQNMDAFLADLKACHRAYLTLKERGAQDRPPMANSPEVFKLKGRLEALLESGAKAGALLPHLEKLKAMAPLDADVKALGESVRGKEREECLARRSVLLEARDWQNLAAWRTDAAEVLDPEEALALALEAELARGESLIQRGALDEAERLMETWLLEKGLDRERRQGLLTTLKNLQETRLQARLSEATARYEALEASWKNAQAVLEKSLQEARDQNEVLAMQMKQSVQQAEDLNLENDRLKATLSEKDKTWTMERKALGSDAQALRTAHQNLEKEVEALKAEVSRQSAEADRLRKELVKIKPVQVEIRSEPPGASVTVDGVGQGETPVTVALLSGAHEIVLSKEGYRELRARRDITPVSCEKPIRLTLEALPKPKVPALPEWLIGSGFGLLDAGHRLYPAQPHPLQSTACKELGLPLAIEHRKTGIWLVLIPGGTFWMGASPNDGAASTGETPRHEVTLNPFYMALTPMTQAQWEMVAERANCGFTGPERPVENLSWDDTVAWLREAGGGLRLPTEAQWERAARGGTETPYWWGKDYEVGMANCDESHLEGGSYLRETSPVGAYPPNPFGLFDILGNVLEWCSDWYNEKYYKASPSQDPQGPSTGESRGLRGGSWYHGVGPLRASYRFRYNPENRGNSFGFRPVLPTR
jgi:formylglycine-generating enzyme required for sulfatase activity/serine/threonine protein kinase